MVRMLLLSVLLTSQVVADEATICPKDTIVLHIAAVPADESSVISGKYRVDDAGKINLPYLGKFIIGGFTPAEAARIIDESFVSHGYFTHPSTAISIKVPDPSVAEVGVGGSVQHPDEYRLKTPATIEQALASAGGWSGSGELGIAPKGCSLTHMVNGESVHSIIRIQVDRKTKQIVILDQTWKEYSLADGDTIFVATVTF